jgi:hypothetical protein
MYDQTANHHELTAPGAITLASVEQTLQRLHARGQWVSRPRGSSDVQHATLEIVPVRQHARPHATHAPMREYANTISTARSPGAPVLTCRLTTEALAFLARDEVYQLLYAAVRMPQSFRLIVADEIGTQEACLGNVMTMLSRHTRVTPTNYWMERDAVCYS